MSHWCRLPSPKLTGLRGLRSAGPPSRPGWRRAWDGTSGFARCARRRCRNCFPHRRCTDAAPLVEILSVLVKNLHARIGAVADVNPSLVVDGDAMDGIELARPLAGLAPFEHGLAVLFELHDASAG